MRPSIQHWEEKLFSSRMSHPAKPSIKHTEKIKHFHVHKECLAMAKCPSSEKKKSIRQTLECWHSPSSQSNGTKSSKHPVCSIYDLEVCPLCAGCTDCRTLRTIWAINSLSLILQLMYFCSIIYWFSINQSKSNLSQMQIILSNLEPT